MAPPANTDSRRRRPARRRSAGPSSTRPRRARSGAAASPSGFRWSAAGTGPTAGRRPAPATATAAAPRPARSPAASRPGAGRSPPRRRRCPAHREVVPDRAGPIGEQPDGRIPRAVSPVPGASGGRPSDPSRVERSPGTPSGSRLVASTRRRGQLPGRLSASSATGADQVLAVVQHQRRLATGQYLDQPVLRGPGGRHLTGTAELLDHFAPPSVASTAGATSAGSPSGASSTSQMPSATPEPAVSRLRPISVASRVLPAPPGPTR